MLNPDIPCFESNVNPDQLASEKPADLDLHFFYPACKYMVLVMTQTGIMQVKLLKIEK